MFFNSMQVFIIAIAEAIESIRNDDSILAILWWWIPGQADHGVYDNHSEITRWCTGSCIKRMLINGEKICHIEIDLPPSGVVNDSTLLATVPTEFTTITLK